MEEHRPLLLPAAGTSCRYANTLLAISDFLILLAAKAIEIAGKIHNMQASRATSAIKRDYYAGLLLCAADLHLTHGGFQVGPRLSVGPFMQALHMQATDQPLMLTSFISSSNPQHAQQSVSDVVASGALQQQLQGIGLNLVSGSANVVCFSAVSVTALCLHTYQTLSNLVSVCKWTPSVMLNNSFSAASHRSCFFYVSEVWLTQAARGALSASDTLKFMPQSTLPLSSSNWPCREARAARLLPQPQAALPSRPLRAAPPRCRACRAGQRCPRRRLSRPPGSRSLPRQAVAAGAPVGRLQSS